MGKNNKQNKVVVIIPARLKSTRLAEKLLLEIAGKSIIEQVFIRVKRALLIADIFIATDEPKLFNHCMSFTNNVIMTSNTHESGTGRLSEAVKNIDCQFVVNVQADELFIDPQLIDLIADNCQDQQETLTAGFYTTNQQIISSPTTAKITLDNKGNALYFSRSVIPFNHTNQALDYLIHFGIYAYSKNFLLNYSQIPKSHPEQIESLEQLRVLAAGYKMRVIIYNHNRPLAIDTLEDYLNAQKIFKNYN